MGACKYYAVTVAGIQMLLEDSRCGLFEIVVAEVLGRVSRDQTDVANTLHTPSLRSRDNCLPVGR